MNDAPIVAWDPGIKKWVYRASALGGCETAMLAARMNLTQTAPPDDFAAIFAEGQKFEQELIDRFVALNIGWQQVPETAYEPGRKDLLSFGPTHEGQARIELPVGVRAVIRAHADALVAHGPTVFRVLEVKAFSDSLMRDFERGAFLEGDGLWEKYRVQLSIMMHGLRMPAVIAAGLKVDDPDADGGRKIDRLHYQYIDTPPVSLAWLKARVARIEARAEVGEELVCRKTDYPCPFFFLHAPRDEEDAAVELHDDELAQLLTLRADLRAAASVVDTDLKATNKQITDLLAKHGRTDKGMRTVIGCWSVRWMEVEQPASTRKAYTSRYPLIKKITEESSV